MRFIEELANYRDIPLVQGVNVNQVITAFADQLYHVFVASEEAAGEKFAAVNHDLPLRVQPYLVFGRGNHPEFRRNLSLCFVILQQGGFDPVFIRLERTGVKSKRFFRLQVPAFLPVYGIAAAVRKLHQ